MSLSATAPDDWLSLSLIQFTLLVLLWFSMSKSGTASAKAALPHGGTQKDTGPAAVVKAEVSEQRCWDILLQLYIL